MILSISAAAVLGVQEHRVVMLRVRVFRDLRHSDIVLLSVDFRIQHSIQVELVVVVLLSVVRLG